MAEKSYIVKHVITPEPISKITTIR
jgi:hypothetical protein